MRFLLDSLTQRDMVTHISFYGHPYLKTTVDISDDLLEKAKALASQKQTTLRAIIETGIRIMLKEVEHSPPYRLPDKSVDGEGLQPEFRNGTWPDIRDAIYRDHGN